MLKQTSIRILEDYLSDRVRFLEKMLKQFEKPIVIFGDCILRDIFLDHTKNKYVFSIISSDTIRFENKTE